MRIGMALPPAKVEALRQDAYQREFELALKQRRRIYYAQMKAKVRREKGASGVDIKS